MSVRGRKPQSDAMVDSWAPLGAHYIQKTDSTVTHSGSLTEPQLGRHEMSMAGNIFTRHGSGQAECDLAIA